MLTYRLPREPSAPRLALWRKLRRLGVAQLADGLVALPRDSRTQEHLEWAAEDVVEAGGSAGVWFARPSTRALESAVAGSMDTARAAEYAGIVDEAEAAQHQGTRERSSLVRRLRAELRRVERRDFFRPPQREQARQAVTALGREHVRGEEGVGA